MPGFLTQQMQGPLYEVSGHYFGVSPGIASWDLFNQFNPDNTVQGVASMLTPIVKTPLEMALGTDLSTGARINDLSDHLDSALPVVNTVSNLTGTSVTGSPVSLLTGKGLDPQYQVAKGNKSLTDQLISGFDKVSGLGIKDYSQPNYLNLAAIEKRNAAAPGAGGIKW